jgi:hypothetical protein
MSKGPGHIQRSILALIDSDPDHGDGAWTLGQICEHVYPGINRVEKKHRVAVARALRKMTLPEPWKVDRMIGHGEEYCLYNSCSLFSAARLDWHAECKRCDRLGWQRRPDDDIAEFMRRRPHCYEPSDYYNYNTYARVQRAIRWRDGSEIERIEMQIEDIKRSTGLLGEEWVAKERAKLPKLRTRLAELKATAKVSVSDAKPAPHRKHLGLGSHGITPTPEPTDDAQAHTTIG